MTQVTLTALVLGSGMPYAQDSAVDEGADLAKQLANPIASPISVPLQYNCDENYGVGDEGSKHVLNIQPVASFTLNEKWKVITRTIVPLVDAEDIPLGSITQLFKVGRGRSASVPEIGIGPIRRKTFPRAGVPVWC